MAAIDIERELTWVEGVCLYISAFQICCKLLCKQDICQLGLTCRKPQAMQQARDADHDAEYLVRL